MDRKKFAAAITMLSQTIPPCRPISPAATEGYWLGLKDLTDEQLEAATSIALRNSKFMPSPRELRDFVEAPARITPAMEWANVRRVMDTLDIYGSPDFGPVANAVIHALGGWKELCEKTIDELNWCRKDFERIYADFAAGDVSRLRTAGHIGAHGKAPKWVALPGIAQPQKQLASPCHAQVSEVARALADSKSVEP